MHDTLSPEQRDTNDNGRSAFKAHTTGYTTNKPTTATYFTESKWHKQLIQKQMTGIILFFFLLLLFVVVCLLSFSH